MRMRDMLKLVTWYWEGMTGACPCHASSSRFWRPLNFTILFFVLLTCMLFQTTMPAVAATYSKPARSETLIAGPYTIIMGLSSDPPIVGQDLTVTIAPRESVPLSGILLAQPGAGTDAIVVKRTLRADGVHMLDSVVLMPVRGAWTLLVTLHGPQGSGTASLDVIVAAPNAIPPWEGWMIGLLPLVGFAWLIWWQWKYRRTLLKQSYQK